MQGQLIVERGHSRISRFQGQEDSSSFMVSHPPTDIHVNTAQCGTVGGRSSYFSHFTHASFCQKSAEMLLFPSGSWMLEQTNKDVQRRILKNAKNEPSYQNTNFSLWTEPLWFLISPMIAAFPHQISLRPPPPHFRVFSQDRVLFFIKRSEVIRLSFLRLSRISAAIHPFCLQKSSLDIITHPLAAVPHNYKPIPKCSLQIFYFSSNIY